MDELVLTPDPPPVHRQAFAGLTEGKDEWLTPPHIIKSLGEFDLDPCSPIERPWPTAKQHYHRLDNGLMKEWAGRVWMNPPYGPETSKWMSRLAAHGNGIAFIFARTETETFFKHVWPVANAILFLKGRVRFHHVSGRAADAAGAPSCLIAYGNENVEALGKSGIPGKLLRIQ